MSAESVQGVAHLQNANTPSPLSCTPHSLPPLYSTFGESLFLAIQVSLIAMLIFVYRQQWVGLLLFGPVLAGTAYVLCSGLAPIEVLSLLQTSSIPLLIASRVSVLKLIQIHTHEMYVSTAWLMKRRALSLF